MRFILNILTTAFLCLLLTMCKKESSEPEPICQYDSSIEGVKSWYYYKTGTRWIYQEQTSGAFDTITVYYDWAGTNANGAVNFEVWATSTYSDYRYVYEYSSVNMDDCVIAGECKCHKLSRTKTRPFDHVGTGYIFLYPVIKGNSTPSGESNSTVLEIYPEFQLGDLSFTNVAELDVPDDESKGGVRTKYWVSQNVGIIKHANFNTGKEWHLVEYEIVR